jgi:para-nitrobenzyl esterase
MARRPILIQCRVNVIAQIEGGKGVNYIVPKHITTIAAVAILALGLTASPASAAEPQSLAVTTEYGAVQGVRLSGHISAFRGIPYAAPPIGMQRWKPPAPPTHWEGVRQATEYGSACLQLKSRLDNIYADAPFTTSEDCLYLNVWKPDGVKHAPVMVWIHGGAFSGGTPGSGLYDGAELSRRGVIVVSMNYRLGILGFLAHPQLSQESTLHVSGNYGLLDQLAALHWVKDNIAAFGGDPENVTVFGESAGATSVMDLLVSPPARGLFSKAIIESGYMVCNAELRTSRYGLPSAEDSGVATANALGAKSLEDLRNRDGQELVAASAKTGFVPLPTIDGWLLPHQLVDAFDSGEQARVPILVGFNAGETRSLRGLLPPVPANAADYELKIRQLFGDLSDDYLKLYPSTNLEESVLQATRDGLYSWTAQRLALKQAAVGQPAYLYYFAHTYPSETPLAVQAFHASELPFVFGHVGPNANLPPNWPKPPNTRQEKALSAAMVSYWTSFARTGTPTSAHAPAWKTFAEGESYMEFRDKPLLLAHPVPGVYAMTEELISRRRAAGNQYWFTNFGLASPPVPAKASQ